MDYKIEVHSKAESRLVQEHAFKLGCAWADGAKHVQLEDEPYIYLENNTIECGGTDAYFDKYPCLQINVDDFLELNFLKEKIENSRGAWRINSIVMAPFHDTAVTEHEVRDCRRFDTEQQAKEALNDVNKVLNTRQVANALGLDITLAYKSIEGENDKNIDRFKAEMKRRGF